MEIKVQRLSKHGRVPTKINDSDAGWDIYASEDAIIDPSQSQLVSTDMAMAIPEGYVGLIWDRSGMAAKKGIHRFAGVIDSGYRGEIKVCLWNSSEDHCIINKGERIAQILFQLAPPFVLKEVENLDKTERGKDGFGSSGM
tara:strand:+ start:2069 stop:2491 length:423 start_codon:yes stop_codon:yes gene_type:complete